MECRALEIDLNPNCIGLAVAPNREDHVKVQEIKLPLQALVKLDKAIDASPEFLRKTLQPPDLDGAQTSLPHDRDEEGIGQAEVERQKPFPHQTFLNY
jgi:hypothetical protein